MTLAGKRILLIISGGIAAYKALELIRLIQKSGGAVTAVLTESAQPPFLFRRCQAKKSTPTFSASPTSPKWAT